MMLLMMMKQDVFDFIRLNTRLQPSEMCGVFLGYKCAAVRMSDTLNWTINIPEKLQPSESEVSSSSLDGIEDAEIEENPSDDETRTRQSLVSAAHPKHRQNRIKGKLVTSSAKSSSTDDSFISRIWRAEKIESMESMENSFEVVQLTDIHFDPYFSPGSRTDCGEPVCCRSVNGPATSINQMAGIWGDYTDCDTPYFTIDSALKRVAAQHPDVSPK